MIALKRNEEVEIYQVELALKVKTKQSPFIAILILAQEREDISAETLQQNLLTSLPVRACENLLKRLEQQGYLQKRQTYLYPSENYSLTELGESSAVDKSFWIGEKGVYNIYVSKSNLIQQDIIFIEKGKVEMIEQRKQIDGTLNIKEIRTPQFQGDKYLLLVKDIFYDEKKKQVVTTFEKKEIHIEGIDTKCYFIKSIDSNLEIQAKENETILKLSKDNQLLFQTNIEADENNLQTELLSTCEDFEYHQDKKAILTDFNKDNLLFNRKVKIGKPIFQRNAFNPIELENISHIPSDKKNAELWYSELLYKNLNQYFLDENSFDEYAVELAKPIQTHFKVSVPNKNKFAEKLGEREDAFYQTAKLETIDFLNY